MNNYKGYELAEYAGDYVEEIDGYLVIPVTPVGKPKEMFYGLFKFTGVITYCSNEAKQKGLEK